MHCATRRSVAPHRPLSSVSVSAERRATWSPPLTPAPLAEVVRIACRHCETAAFAHEQVSLHHAKTAFAPHDSHVCATRKAHPAAFGNHAAGAGADTLQLQMTAGAETLTITNDSYSHAENAPVTLSHAGSRSPLRADPFVGPSAGVPACRHEKWGRQAIACLPHSNYLRKVRDSNPRYP